MKKVLLLMIALALTTAVQSQTVPVYGPLRSSGSAFPTIYSPAIVFPADADYTPAFPLTSGSSGVMLVTSAVSLTATHNLILPLVKGLQFTLINDTTGGQSFIPKGITGAAAQPVANCSVSPSSCAVLVATDGVSYVQVGAAASSSSGTVTNTAGSLTLNHCLLGNGGADAKVDSGCTSDGAGNVTVKTLTTTGGGGGAGTASQLQLVPNGAAPTVLANSTTLAAPAAVTAASTVVLPVAPYSGPDCMTNSAGVMQEGQCTGAQLAAAIQAGANVTVTPSANGVTIAASASGGSSGPYILPAGSKLYFEGSSITRAPHNSGGATGSQLPGGGLSGNYGSIVAATAWGASATYYNDGVDGQTSTGDVAQYNTGNNNYGGITVPSAHSVSPSITGSTQPAYYFLDLSEIGNDIAAGISTATSISNLQTLVGKAQADGWTVVLITTPILPYVTGGHWNQLIQVNTAALNGTIPSGKTGSTYPMVYDASAVLQNTLDPIFFQGGHPSTSGHARLAAGLLAGAVAGNWPVNYSQPSSNQSQIFNAPISTVNGATVAGGLSVDNVVSSLSVTGAIPATLPLSSHTTDYRTNDVSARTLLMGPGGAAFSGLEEMALAADGSATKWLRIIDPTSLATGFGCTFYTTSTCNVYIKQDGSVGIGTQTPIDPGGLDIMGSTVSSTSTVFENSNAAGWSGYSFADNTRAVKASVFYSNPSASFFPGSVVYASSGAPWVYTVGSGTASLTVNGPSQGIAVSALSDTGLTASNPAPICTGANSALTQTGCTSSSGSGTLEHTRDWFIYPAAHGASGTLTNTLWGAVYFDTSGSTIRAVTARLEYGSDTTCATAPVITIMDLGTSPNTSYGAATVLTSLTTVPFSSGTPGTGGGGFSATGPTVFSSTGLAVAVPIGHYIGAGFSAGSCSVDPPTFSVTTTHQ